MQEPLNFKLMPVTPLPISEVSPAPETLMLQTVQLEEISFKSAQFYYSQQQKYNSSHNFLSVNTLLKENYYCSQLSQQRPNKSIPKRTLVYAHGKFCS